MKTNYERLKMDSIYNEQECYLGKCGEMFLTVEGNITFHCSLCENQFKSFQEYNDHILESHYVSDLREELSEDDLQKEHNQFDPLSEGEYPANDGDLIFKEEEFIEDCAILALKNTINTKHENTRLQNSSELLLEPIELQKDERNLQTTGKSFQIEEIIPTLRTINVKPTIKNRKYKCPHCGFTGADKSNMRSHIRRHSTKKPHKCTECFKTFHTRTELNTHLRIHTGEKPFLCTLCGRAFTTSSKLCNHQKRHNNIKDKECPICNMRFYGSESLRGHMVVHSEKRDYKCTVCDASFKLRMGLRTHMKLHENKREYHCKLCDSRFNQHAGLYSHMKSCHTVILNSSKLSYNCSEVDN